MKKKLLLFAFATLAVAAHSQITITQTGVGPVGSIFYLGADTILPVGYDLGTPGTNVTWDFTQLDQDYYDTIYYLDPNNTPHASDYPTANLSVTRATQPDAYAYFEKNSSEFLLLGFAADPLQMGTPLLAHQTPPSKSAVFPWTYGSTLQDTSTFTFRIDGTFLGFPGVDSVEYISTTIRNVECDSWGNLMLWGNNYAALRNKEIRNTHDLVNARFFGNWTNFQDTTFTDSAFIYTNDTKGYTLAEATYEGGRLVSIVYQDANPVAIHDRIDAATHVFPNPAQNQIHVANAEGSLHALRLIDMRGALVRDLPVTGLETTISLQGLSPGIYLLQGNDLNGTTVVSRKVVVR